LLCHNQGQLKRQEGTQSYYLIKVAIFLTNTQQFRSLATKRRPRPAVSNSWIGATAKTQAKLSGTYLILAIQSGLFVIDGEEQHIPKVQI